MLDWISSLFWTYLMPIVIVAGLLRAAVLKGKVASRRALGIPIGRRW